MSCWAEVEESHITADLSTECFEQAHHIHSNRTSGPAQFKNKCERLSGRFSLGVSPDQPTLMDPEEPITGKSSISCSLKIRSNMKISFRYLGCGTKDFSG